MFRPTAPHLLLLLLVSAASGLPAPGNRLQDDRMQHARQAVAGGRLELARTLFQEIVALDPDNGEAHFYLAQLWAREDRERETIDHYLKAVALLPDVERVRNYWGRWLLDHGYWSEAERIFLQLRASDTGSLQYCSRYGEALYSGGNPDAALEVLKGCLELPEAGARELYLAGLAARMLGRQAEARGYLERGLALAPGDPDLNFQMADELLEQGQPEASLPFWAHLPDDHLEGLYGQAVARARLGQLDRARDLLETVLARAPEHTRAHYQLALLYRKQGEIQKSTRLFQRFRELEAADRERRRHQVKKEIVIRNPPGG